MHLLSKYCSCLLHNPTIFIFQSQRLRRVFELGAYLSQNRETSADAEIKDHQLFYRFSSLLCRCASLTSNSLSNLSFLILQQAILAGLRIYLFCSVITASFLLMGFFQALICFSCLHYFLQTCQSIMEIENSFFCRQFLVNLFYLFSIF